jgi:dTDP-glucose 4,6-dehydratase
MQNHVLVTGGAGFIGSNFVLQQMQDASAAILNLDKLTYAGNLCNLESIAADRRYKFIHGDIGDRELVRQLLEAHRPGAIVHFAAESHVDRSIRGPEDFIRTNVDGTFALLEETRAYWNALPEADRNSFRFLHVSTDEVYGSLSPASPAFTEETPYAPNSPYSASKASSDHLARAYFHTYGLPVLTTNCSNNYGPRQMPEKLIPLMLLRALQGLPLPVYGDGLNTRDWLYVDDHCEGLRTVLAAGVPGQTYNIGGRQEMTNLELVRQLCSILDEIKPARRPYADLISFVKDRQGHDRRYAIDCSKIEQELGWQPRQSFAGGLRKTVEWYLSNAEWVERATSGSHREWMKLQYAPSGLAGSAS